jgi:hypothetical protein
MLNPHKTLPNLNVFLYNPSEGSPKHIPTLKEIKDLCAPPRKWLEKCLNNQPSYIELLEKNSTGTVEVPIELATLEDEKEQFLKRSFNTYVPHAKDDKLLAPATMNCLMSYYTECSKKYEQPQH